jgi:hypothetical protein
VRRRRWSAPPPCAAGPSCCADRQDAEARQWYRVQVREMLAAGWGRAELADVGITDALLQELGLTPFAAE